MTIAGGKLHAPVVNPTDKYQERAQGLHKYGQYLLSCLPKYIQQFSVWKDELTIYIPPAGVIPVISFLKYHTAAEYTMATRNQQDAFMDEGDDAWYDL